MDGPANLNHSDLGILLYLEKLKKKKIFMKVKYLEEHQFKRETNFTLKIFYDKIDVDHITKQQREAYSAAV